MASPMGVLGGLKSKLGLGARKGDNYDEYDEYDEYGEYDDYDEYDDGGYDDYDDRYDDRDRYSRNGRSRRDSGYDRERDRYSNRDLVTSRGVSHANLVTYDDVRHSSRSSYSSPRTSAARTMVDSSLPPSLTPEGYAAASAAASRKRTDGLDSLFSSTAGDTQSSSGGLGIIGAAAGDAASAGAHARGSLDSASFGDGASGFKANRQVVVLRPTDYNDVESVASTLKSGDAVILSLKLTPDSLSKRILDFSFGVASALDASVDCISDKVFAITRGAALTETELSTLRAQGVVA